MEVRRVFQTKTAMATRSFILVWIYLVGNFALTLSWTSHSVYPRTNRGRSTFESPLNSVSSERPESSFMSPSIEDLLPSSNDPVRKKRLLCVRHGVSVANEWMAQPGNEWGDPDFADNDEPDARLSVTGRQKTEEYLSKQFEDPILAKILDEVELVLVSPLTRCLETFEVGVAPLLKPSKNRPQLAVPLLRERVYTTSDTGRLTSVLEKEFPTIDFSECPRKHPWWYTGENEESYTEWRPNGENQYYGVRGEPQATFERRMKDLDNWLSERPEGIILIVAHWGVLRHLTDGTQWKNAEAKILNYEFCPLRRTSTISHADD